MKKFLVKVSLFVAACVALVTLIAIYKERDNIRYSRKRTILEDNKDASCIIAGTSHALWGLDPAVFSVKTINIAELDKPIDYDLAIIEKYIYELPSLRYLILPIGYFTLFYSDSLALSDEFAIKYPHHWGIKDVLNNNLSFYKLDRYHFYTCGLDILEKEDKKGVDDYGYDPQFDVLAKFDSASKEKFCLERLGYWNEKFIHRDKQKIEKTGGDIIRFCNFLESKNISVYFVNMPVSVEMQRHLDSGILKINAAFVDELRRTTKAHYIDLQDSTIFKNDSLFHDQDHLNYRGAMVASGYINADLFKANLN